ncbi:MAG TPA: M6 family metalloprotease domain-containing protein, partial [Streptomyces sp.]|nr:M6 family metalloprotease domain-containing protein [Streptomyces sp.]
GPLTPPAARPDATCAPAPPAGVQTSEGIPTPAGHAPTTGTLRALTLMIDFPDVPGEGSARARFAEFFPRTADWYAAASYGALDYRAETPVGGWLRMPRTFASYGIARGAGYEPGYRRLVQDIAATADDKVDFSAYDLINVLVTPNAGPSAVDTVLSVTFAGVPGVPRADGVPLGNMSFVYSRQNDGSPGAAANAYRVLPHENAHSLGLPDLYTSEGGGAAGHWDIMSEDWGANNDFLGWHKRKLGWLDGDRQIDCATGSGSSHHTIRPLGRAGGPSGRTDAHPGSPARTPEDTEDTRLVYIPVTNNAGYAVEVRTQEGNDAAVCKPGVLVYWVDTRIGSGDGPVAIRDSTPNSGGCAHRSNVNAELTDATFGVGDTYTDERTGITVEVSARHADGAHHVTVTRP